MLDPRGQLGRRRVTVAALLLGAAGGAVLIAFAPLAGVPVTALFVLALGLDIVLLASHAHRAAERAMTAAFRSRSAGPPPATRRP